MINQVHPQSFLGSGGEDFFFLSYMGMVAILFNGVKPFDKIVNIPLTEGPVWNLVKIWQAVSEKMFKDYMILYMYVAQGPEQITSGGQNFDCN